MHVLALSALTIFLGCKDNSVDEWVRFNAEDRVYVEVTAELELGLPIAGELLSTTETTVLGAIYVDPGSGPVGTDHEISVSIDEKHKEMVDRVTVVADAGERGQDEYELRQDSVDHGFWMVTLTSIGESGEVRTDAFEIALWEAANVSEE
jgi:hypothetical protein